MCSEALMHLWLWPCLWWQTEQEEIAVRPTNLINEGFAVGNGFTLVEGFLVNWNYLPYHWSWNGVNLFRTLYGFSVKFILSDIHPTTVISSII